MTSFLIHGEAIEALLYLSLYHVIYLSLIPYRGILGEINTILCEKLKRRPCEAISFQLFKSSFKLICLCKGKYQRLILNGTRLKSLMKNLDRLLIT